MRIAWLALGLVTSLVAAPSSGSVSPPALAAADPVHTIAVTGTGVATYPDFDPNVSRYGVTTSGATAGTVTVTATTDDPGGQVLVNGRPAEGGTSTLTGLEPGDEVAVFIVDSAGTARHSYVYLPEDFPTLERMTAEPDPGDLAPGLVMLTLGLWTSPSPFFQTAVDVNGVPAFVREPAPRAMDLKRQPNGHYSVSESETTPGRTGQHLVELDEQLRPVATHRTADLVDTDGHDSIILPDGSVWLMAYEPNAVTGLTDSVIQRLDADGDVTFHWSSEEYADETVVDPSGSGADDYAHINSFQIAPDGDLIVSFRHLSSVFKIATSAHDGFDVYDVVWKLGGRDSDFTFPVGDLGPCAQHTAAQLPDGNVLIFDNGSWNASEPYCVDPADPTGDPVERPETRVVEFALDEDTGIADVAFEYAPPGRFAIFAGSAQRLANGNTLIGWASSTDSIASEIADDGTVLWELQDPASPPYFTYRAHKAAVADETAPEVSLSVPVDGASYVEGSAVDASYECSDLGGSSLQTCDGSLANGQALDTSSPGPHQFTVTATDGAGNSITGTHTYVVEPATQPDAMIRVAGTNTWTGADRYGSADSQQLRTRLSRPGGDVVVKVRLRNNGAFPTRLRYDVRGGGQHFSVQGRHLRGGTTRTLQPGESWTFALTILRKVSASPGDHAVVRFLVSSSRAPARRDAVSVNVVARRH